MDLLFCLQRTALTLGRLFWNYPNDQGGLLPGPDVYRASLSPDPLPVGHHAGAYHGCILFVESGRVVLHCLISNLFGYETNDGALKEIRHVDRGSADCDTCILSVAACKLQERLP